MSGEILKKLEILWSVKGCWKDPTAVPAGVESVPGAAGELVHNRMFYRQSIKACKDRESVCLKGKSSGISRLGRFFAFLCKDRTGLALPCSVFKGRDVLNLSLRFANDKS